MQKKIIALAIAGLSTAAFAQSNVQIYGNLDASIVKYSGTSAGVPGTAAGAGTGTGTITKIDANAIKQSRLGFKGTEALGGGSNAVWVAEQGIATDGGAGVQGGNTAVAGGGLGGAWRQIYVGLESPYGTTTLGRQYTPFFTTAAAIDNFGMTGVGSLANLHAIGAPDVRFSSSVKYASPVFSGVQATLHLGMGEQPSDSTVAPKGTSYALVYANGPIVAGYAGITLKDTDATGAGLTAAGQIGLKVKADAFGGSYNFGMVKVGGLYVKTKVTTPAATAVDNGGYNLNATMPMGAHTFKVAMNRTNDKLAANHDASHLALGYQYDLSKRTSMHVQFGRVNNKNGANYGVDPRTTLAVNGILGATNGTASREKGLVMGMNHEF